MTCPRTAVAQQPANAGSSAGSMPTLVRLTWFAAGPFHETLLMEHGTWDMGPGNLEDGGTEVEHVGNLSHPGSWAQMFWNTCQCKT